MVVLPPCLGALPSILLAPSNAQWRSTQLRYLRGPAVGDSIWPVSCTDWTLPLPIRHLCPAGLLYWLKVMGNQVLRCAMLPSMGNNGSTHRILYAISAVSKSTHPAQQPTTSIHLSASPRISVILPTYNRLAFLPRAINSVLDQSVHDLELIVVDDGSTDGTAEYIAAHDDPRVRYLPLAGNQGPAVARNRAVEMARGEWLAFQDSDDVWLPGKLAGQLALAASAGPDLVCVGSGLQRKVGERTELWLWPIDAQGHVVRTEFLRNGFAFLQSMLVRRQAIIDVGGFDGAMPARSDFEFALRLQQAGSMQALSDIFVVSYETPGSVSLKLPAQREAAEYLLRKHAVVLESDRRIAAAYWYHLAKMEALLDHRWAAFRAAMASLLRWPFAPKAWALLIVAPAGSRALRRLMRQPPA